jgi:hypothetical protein
MDSPKEVVTSTEEHCTRCGVTLTEENWNPSRQKRNLRYCKGCDNSYSNQWDEEHPGERNAITRRYYHAHPEMQARRTPEEQKAYHGAHKDQMSVNQKKYDKTPAGRLSSVEKQRRYRLRHPEKVKAYFEAHKGERSESARVRLWKLKKQAIEILGGKCIVCGLADLRVLQINHKKGYGGKEARFGQDMYRAIVKEFRLIEDLNVMCANHNIIYEYERGARKLPIMATS